MQNYEGDWQMLVNPSRRKRIKRYPAEEWENNPDKRSTNNEAWKFLSIRSNFQFLTHAAQLCCQTCASSYSMFSHFVTTNSSRNPKMELTRVSRLGQNDYISHPPSLFVRFVKSRCVISKKRKAKKTLRVLMLRSWSSRRWNEKELLFVSEICSESLNTIRTLK